MYAFTRNRKQNRWSRMSAVAAALALSGAALAQQPPVPPQAQAEHWPQAVLRAEAADEVAQDTVRITLAQEVSGASQAAISESLTSALDQAMRQAKGVTEVKASSGNYRIWPHTDKEGQITNWRGRAEIHLESRDFAAASALASRLSEHMPIAGIGFSVSDQARNAKESELLALASASFRERAQVLAESFGYQEFSIRNIELSGGAPFRPGAPRMMAMPAAASAEKADVPLQGDTETVSVSIYGSIFLQRKK